MKNIEVAGFGALNIDNLYRVNKISCEDDESYIKDLSVSCGGSAANTMIGLSRLGVKTGFIGKIAKDQEGKLLHSNLKKEKVDTEGIIVSNYGRSGKVLGFVDEYGERSLYVDPGVNDDITFNEVNLEYLNNLKLLHLTSFVGDSIKAQRKVVNDVSEDITVSFDPGRIYVEKGISYIKDILERTNIVLINEEELNNLFKNKHTKFKERVEALMEYGVDVVVVKKGKKGAYVTDDKISYNIKPFNVKCVDTTGAGDAFNAGFIYGFLKGENLKKSTIIGNFIASRCIGVEGAIKGLPMLHNLKELDLSL